MPLFHDMMLNTKLGVDFIGSTANSGLISSATLSAANPTNVTNDYLFAHAIVDQDGDVITMSPWSSVSANTTVSSHIFTRTSNGNLGSTSTVNFTTTSVRDKVLSLSSFRGVSTVTTGTISSSLTSTLTATSINMPSNGLLLASFFWRSNGGAPALSVGPSGMTLINYTILGDVAVATYYQQVGGGSTGNKVLTTALATDRNHAILIGLT